MRIQRFLSVVCQIAYYISPIIFPSFPYYISLSSYIFICARQGKVKGGEEKRERKNKRGVAPPGNQRGCSGDFQFANSLRARKMLLLAPLLRAVPLRRAEYVNLHTCQRGRR